MLLLLAIHSYGFYYAWGFLNQQSVNLKIQKESYASSWKSLFKKYGQPEVDIVPEREFKNALVELFQKSDQAMAEGKALDRGWGSQKRNESDRISAADVFYVTTLYTFSAAYHASWQLADDNTRISVFIPGFVEWFAILGIGLWWILSSLTPGATVGSLGPPVQLKTDDK